MEIKARFVALLVVAAAPALAQPVGAQTPGTPVEKALPSQAICEKLDALWETRDEGASQGTADQLLREGLRADPKDYGLLWRASRQRWWQADGMTNKAEQSNTAKIGLNYGDSAIAANPKGVEGYFFAAANSGPYSSGVGIMRALTEGLEGRFLKNQSEALRLAPDYRHGGATLMKGRYYYKLPWPKRDYDKSKAELEKVLLGHPENLRAHYYLAETLEADGDKAGAKAHLEAVLAGGDTYDAPEARRLKALAKGMLGKR